MDVGAILVKRQNCRSVVLYQGSQTRVSPGVLKRPASSSIFLYFYLKYAPPSAAREDIFPPYVAYEFVFIQNVALTQI